MSSGFKFVGNIEYAGLKLLRHEMDALYLKGHRLNSR